MQVITNNTIDTVTRYTGVGLGNFDGLHIGHMALINTLISECKLHGLKSVVYTFIKHPDHMLRKALISPLITANEQKTQLLASTELDYLYYEEFDEEYSQLSPDEFIKNILMDKLKIKLAVVGFNYRFGYMGRGDSEYLKRAGKKLGFRVIVMPPVKVNAEIVSSTLIRSYIRRGKIDRVFQLLGRHFSLTGTVVCGRHIGRTLGFPTANILANPEMVITKTRLEGRWLNGITNVGVAPTVRGENIFSIETHLFEYEGDLYGKPIEVCFIQRLRGERKFENIAALKKQVAEDIEETRRYWEVLK